MKYKVTQQYAKDIEKLIAEFQMLDDATFFIERKLLFDSEKHITLIYRLFDNQDLIKEFNKEKINCSILPGEYATGDKYLPDIDHYKISKNNESMHASFIELSDAELFVEDKVTHSKEIITYFIFNHDKKIIELNRYIKKIIDSN